ncbi:MAG: TerB family tellurite resistance protein [Kiritimatiellae bacterium]|jgi:tellurite resistance protein|nr:TerB family tellurite resistance protein [Kiritimatiellia bacterium]
MGVVIFFVIIIVLVIIGCNSSDNTSTAGSVTNTVDNTFKVRVRETREEINGISFDLFVVETRGAINCPSDNYNATAELLAFDVTDGNKKPLISTLEVFQLADTIAFGFVSKSIVPYVSSVITDWTCVGKIPIDVLRPPRKGNRKIQFLYNLVGTNASATTHVYHDFPEEGYIDATENRKKFDSLAIELAFAVCSCDGDVHADEAAVVKDWIKRRMDVAPEQERESFKKLLNETISEAYKNFQEGVQVSYSSLCDALKEVSTVSERYEVLELGLHVAKADGVAEQEELELLDVLARFLEVDKDKYRTMRDKHLSVSIMRNKDVIDAEKLLGLNSGMSVAEKRKHLRAEYKKWNQLVEHKDNDKRKQAREMLEIIGQKMAELKRECV